MLCLAGFDSHLLRLVRGGRCRIAAAMRFGFASMAACFVLLYCTTPCWAQLFAPAPVMNWNVFDMETVEAAPGNLQPPRGTQKFTPSFTLPGQSPEVRERVDEYHRFVEHQAWEKAFEVLETISAKTATGFVDRGDQVLMPSQWLMRSLLASLPPPGKQAYRVFFDAQAAALWNQAQGRSELDNLVKIVNNHLICSWGDRAADRLGDLYFERGDLDRAVQSWRSLVTYCPESTIPASQTLLKMAVALARQERWAELDEIEPLLNGRYATEMVTIGGRRQSAVQHLTELASQRHIAQSTAKPLPGDILLPESNEPLWQFRYQSKPDPNNPVGGFALMDVYGRMRSNDFAIPATADDSRVYLNLFGIEMAFDLDTGKLLWRSGKLHQLQLQQPQQRQVLAPERYALALMNGRLWSVTRDPQQLNQQPAIFSLLARDPVTGAEVFNSRRTMSTWNILGLPFVYGDLMYVGAARSNQGRELAVLVLNAADGKLIKTINLGNFAVDQNQLFTDRVSEPTFCVYRDRLFVDTNGGAIVAIQMASSAIDWALLYESPPQQQGYNYNELAPTSSLPSAPIFAHGLLFAKGMRSSRLLGINVHTAQASWSRPVPQNAVLLGADEKRLYLGGSELTAYDLKTKELAWYAPLPMTGGWGSTLITQNRLYQFTSRGICEIDKHNGKSLRVFRGADLDSFGGTLLVTPNVVLTVSNLGITAYACKPSTARLDAASENSSSSSSRQ